MEDEVSAKSITMPALNFMQLVDVIRKVHDDLSAQASRAVNASLTLRNWLIGFYVEEYERQGVDRTEYGDKLMDRLAESLTMYGVSGVSDGNSIVIGSSILSIPRLRSHCLHNFELMALCRN